MQQVTSPENTNVLNPFKFLLERILGVCAAILLFSMMILTFVDVIGRKWFAASVPGGFELTELMLASLIYLGLPLVTASDGHVAVDLLDQVIPEWLKSAQRMLVSAVMIGAFGVLSWQLWIYAIRTYNYADTTAVLLIPYAPLVFLMAAMATLNTLVQVLMVFVNHGKPILPSNT